MWDERASVFDTHTNMEFTLRAMLLLTVNDFSAFGNLLWYKKKWKKGCPI